MPLTVFIMNYNYKTKALQLQAINNKTQQRLKNLVV